jgi:hypothetical protein
MYFWRKRTFGSGALAGYNTFADIYNIYEAAHYVPTAWDTVRDLFFPKKSSRSSSSSSSDDGVMARLAFILAIAAVLGGILTTAAIVRTVAESAARSRRLKYAMND